MIIKKKTSESTKFDMRKINGVNPLERRLNVTGYGGHYTIGNNITQE